MLLQAVFRAAILTQQVQNPYKSDNGKPIINVQGCPPIAEVMAGVIVHFLTFGRFRNWTAWAGQKLSTHEGFMIPVTGVQIMMPAYLFNHLMMKMPKEDIASTKWVAEDLNTYNACGVMRWNDGVSFPIQSGHPCIGCSEANFWDNGPFYQHLPNFPGFGIEATADKIGVAMGVATGVGIAAHAITTNIRKRKLIREGECEPEEPTNN